MARTKETRANAAPGAGTIFALRAIGLVILARWLFSMSGMDIVSSLSAMASSPWACINLVFLFLLIFLPGIIQQGEATSQAATGQTQQPFLGRWLLLTAAMFAISALVYVARLVATRRRGHVQGTTK